MHRKRKNTIQPVPWVPLAIGLLLLLQGCELILGDDDEPKNPVEYVYVDEDFWSYVGLPENSYWIYREINTGEIDSSYSGGISHRLRDPTKGRQRLTQWVEYRRNTVQLRSEKFSCEWYTAKGKAGLPEVIRKSNYFAMHHIDGSYGLTLSTKDSVKNWEENDIYEEMYSSWHDTIMLGGKEYLNTVQIETGDLWENPAFLLNVYYVKDIGAVYRKFGDGSEWELIRYKIGEQSAKAYTKEDY